MTLRDLGKGVMERNVLQMRNTLFQKMWYDTAKEIEEGSNHVFKRNHCYI
jgi:hypothetical protein